jgi:hypothetical protein
MKGGSIILTKNKTREHGMACCISKEEEEARTTPLAGKLVRKVFWDAIINAVCYTFSCSRSCDVQFVTSI